MTEHYENCSFLRYILDHEGKAPQTVTSAHGAFCRTALEPMLMSSKPRELKLFQLLLTLNWTWVMAFSPIFRMWNLKASPFLRMSENLQNLMLFSQLQPALGACLCVVVICVLLWHPMVNIGIFLMNALVVTTPALHTATESCLTLLGLSMSVWELRKQRQRHLWMDWVTEDQRDRQRGKWDCLWVSMINVAKPCLESFRLTSD